MKRSVPLYLLTVAMLGMGVYLHSAIVAISIVALWGVRASEDILTRKNRDTDIAEMQATLAAHKAKMDLLTKDINNVAERARVILGETY